MNKSFNYSQKPPKVNRFEQMCYQQQLIEEKKKSITEKLESKKREEEAKLKAEKSVDSLSNPSEKKTNNIFSNDGSFLEQFKKLTESGGINGIKSEVKQEIKQEPPELVQHLPSKDFPLVDTPPKIESDAAVKVNSDENSKSNLPEIKSEPLEVEPNVTEGCSQLLDAVKKEPNSVHRDRGTKRKSRWGMTEAESMGNISLPPPKMEPVCTLAESLPTISGPLLSKVTKRDKGLLQYAMTAYGSTDLSDEDWKKAEDNYKVHLLYQDMLQKRAEVERLHAMGKNKYEYDSDEEVDGGTWEHKAREKEMHATAQWADQLTEMAKGKHHIGDFLPPEELKKFMDKYQSIKEGGEPNLSDYKEFKLTEENKGFQMLQKLGWSEGQGLGADGSGIVEPLNKARDRDSNMGLGVERPDDLSSGDDEYDAYRKRMMLAYRFRPNPMNNPRRPYY